MYEIIKDKRIVVWGIGILQSDIIGIFPFCNLLYFVDDFYEEGCAEAFIPSGKNVYSSDRLLIENKTDLFVVICDNDEDYAASRLEAMGFREDVDFGFGENLLINPPLFEFTRSKRIHIWGAGNTYTYHKNEIVDHIDEIVSFIVSESNNNPSDINGRPVVAFDDAQIASGDFIIVCSIHYKEIAGLLADNGYVIGKDFINIRTFTLLAKLSLYSLDSHSFANRSKDSEELLVILSGYKKHLWGSVFPRLKRFIPAHIDVALVTSGLFNDELNLMAADYGWSYISTERNNVSLAVNTAISLHGKAKYIYKIDEDILVTEGCFESMRTAYTRIETESRYEVGFVTPLIPVNGYGYVRILEIFDLTEEWETRFGELIYTDCYRHHVAIHDSPEAALFMWGKDIPVLADIDAMARTMGSADFQYSICPVRYSIGFILFSRRNWLRMGMFPVLEHLNLGADEEHICKFCMKHARVMGVAENALAGHLSYGPQHKAMEEYYRQHTDRFLLKERLR